MIDVQRAFRELLHRNDAVQALVEGRIYPNMAKQWDAADSPSCYIVYHLISKQIERHISGPVALAESRIQADLYADTYDTAQSLAMAVNGATDGFMGTVAVGADDIEIRSVRIDAWEESRETANSASETGWHRVSMDFVIWHEHEKPLFAR